MHERKQFCDQTVIIMAVRLSTLAFHVTLALVISISYAYININQLCKAFDENLQPIICILKNRNNSSDSVQTETVILKPDHSYLLDKIKLKQKLKPRPIIIKPRPKPISRPFYPPHPIYIPPDYSSGWSSPEWEEDDEEQVDCSCDLNCYPVIKNQNPNMTGVSYNCRTCGSSCWVQTATPTNCSCAIPSGNATCTCVATCASFRSGLGLIDIKGEVTLEEPSALALPRTMRKGRMSWGWSDDDDDDSDPQSDSGEDLNCIFTISNLTDTRVGEEQRPYNCACCKSTEAQRTSEADFVCICQRVSATDRAGEVDFKYDWKDKSDQEEDD